MLTAITRAVSPSLNRCELSYLSRKEIDVDLARRQHARYRSLLSGLGVRVISLPAEPDFPDSMFVEDPAIVVDEVAVVTRMGVESRRGEAESLAAALAPFRALRRIEAPGTLEGGDVLRVGKTLWAGLSNRTNREGVEQLARALQPFGYRVHAVEMRDCLHLKSGCSHLGNGAILANRAWIDTAAFPGLEVVDVAEPWAANVLAVGETIVMPSAFPATRERLEKAGWRVESLDTSELMKAEAGVTCMSLLFEGSTVET
jgi:dimethylargininase